MPRQHSASSTNELKPRSTTVKGKCKQCTADIYASTADNPAKRKKNSMSVTTKELLSKML